MTSYEKLDARRGQTFLTQVPIKPHIIVVAQIKQLLTGRRAALNISNLNKFFLKVRLITCS